MTSVSMSAATPRVKWIKRRKRKKRRAPTVRKKQRRQRSVRAFVLAFFALLLFLSPSLVLSQSPLDQVDITEMLYNLDRRIRRLETNYSRSYLYQTYSRRMRARNAGAKIQLFPDSTNAMVVYDDQGNPVFRILIGGDNYGDVIIGDESGQYIKWDRSAGTLTVVGDITVRKGTGIGNFTNISLDSIPDGSTYQRVVSGTVDNTGAILTRVVPGDIANPSGAGLYLGSDYMGYYSGSQWNAYIQNNGHFAFRGDANNRIEWDGDTLTVRGTLNADDITAGTLSVDRIAASSITTSKLYFKDPFNLCPNPQFEGGSTAEWSGPVSAVSSSDADVPTGAPTNYVGKQTNRDAYVGDYFPVQAGDKFYVEVTAARPAGASDYTFNVGLKFSDADTATITHVAGGSVDTTTTWTTASGEVTAPSGSVLGRVWTQINGPWDSTGYWYFTRVIVQRKVDNELLVDASVDSAKIASASIHDAHIADLSADKITTGTLKAGIINADSITSGTFTGLTFQTASSGQRVKISADDNRLEFFSGAIPDTAVVAIDDSVYGAKPGIGMTTSKGGIVHISDGKALDPTKNHTYLTEKGLQVNTKASNGGVDINQAGSLGYMAFRVRAGVYGTTFQILNSGDTDISGTLAVHDTSSFDSTITAGDGIAFSQLPTYDNGGLPNPPTDALLDEAFPNASVGYFGFIMDTNDGSIYMVYKKAASNWYYTKMTAAP